MFKNVETEIELLFFGGLALLPSTSLLPILTSLIQQNPSLKPNVLALIPSPSLPTALEALRLAEQNVMNAVPVGWHKAGGTVSEIYVVGRVKDPVGEVTSLVRPLSFFAFCFKSSSLMFLF